jgi:hypothetical protein
MTDLHTILDGLGIIAKVISEPRCAESGSRYMHKALCNHWLVPVWVVVLDFAGDTPNDLYITRWQVHPDMYRLDINTSSVYQFEDYGSPDDVIKSLKNSRAYIASKLLLP